jgi:hypothetical protein
MRRTAFPGNPVPALLCAALCALAPACTGFDDYLPGTPFTPDQPTAAVTLVDGIYADVVPSDSVVCNPGSTMLWGTVKNTGDLDVDEVFIEIDVFGPGGAFLGTYGGDVFNGETTSPVGSEGAVEVALTDLAVDQAGYFQVCAAVSAGSISRTDYRTSFVVIERSQGQ